LKRYLLFGLLVAVICTPLVLVLFLITAGTVPALDRLTLTLPEGVRTSIAEVALNRAGYGKVAEPKLRRVLRLDPQNPAAWSRLCSIATGDPVSPNAVATCNRAVAYDNKPYDLNHLARAQEAAGDPCTAEDTYTRANYKVSGGNVEYLRSMGRAAYTCGGRLPASIAELEAARDLDAKYASDPSADSDEVEDYKADLQLDREWLILAYTAGHKPQLASEACHQAHAGWKSCVCTLQSGKPSCSELPSHPSR
jgi:hypothetical protein